MSATKQQPANIWQYPLQADQDILFHVSNPYLRQLANVSEQLDFWHHKGPAHSKNENL